MDLNQKTADLAAELNVPADKVRPVTGLSESEYDSAMNAKPEAVEKLCNFFNEREAAFAQYTDEQVGAIREFERLIVQEGNQKKASEKVGIGQSIMSSIRRGKYIAKTDKHFATLTEYFGIKAARNELPDVFVPVDYAPTSISLMIYERLRNAHILGGCAVITGDAGIGKTKTIQKYARDNRTKTIVITASVFNRSPSDMLFMLASELGINDTNKRRIKNELFSKLHDGMMIIVDEAQELTYQAANALRAFPDYFESKNESMGLAFVGNPCFYDKFNGKYTSDRVQVSSRFVAEPTYHASQIQFEDTMMLYPQLTEQNMTAELMFLHSIATTPTLGQRKALFIFKNAYNYGTYDLEALVKEAKEAKIHFDNLNELLRQIKAMAAA